MASPNDRKYTDTHEWIKTSSTGSQVGVTAYGANLVGPITSVDLPAAGTTVTKGQSLGTLNGTSSEPKPFHAPVGGPMPMRNEGLLDRPGTINGDPWNSWLVTIMPADMTEFDSLMTAQQYDQKYSPSA